MRVAHNHRPNGLGARDQNGFLTCASCGRPCEVPDLMAALEESLAVAKAEQAKRHNQHSGAPSDTNRGA